MRVAALLALLAVPPGQAAETVTPAQARANVLSALPPLIARGAGNGDLRTYLERLTPDQKKAALRALTMKEEELGDDPATLGVIGEAYAGLGKVKEARQAAEKALRQNPEDPGARRLLVWVTGKEKLPGRGTDGGPPSGTIGAGSGGPAPAAAGRQADLALERRIQGVFRRGQRSAEFRDTLQDARGLSVAELDAAGISFQQAADDQRDAVRITREGGRFTIAIRPDALNSRGDTEARAAAQVANGVRQAQTLRDHEVIGWALIKARGWISGATTHKELAPNDLETRPTTPSDRNLMVSRKLLDREDYSFRISEESYGDSWTNRLLDAINTKSKDKDVALDGLFSWFLHSSGRGDGG